MPNVPVAGSVSDLKSMFPWDGPLTACRSCGAPISWIKTLAGKNMPVSVATSKLWQGQLYAKSHFADCKFADQHRKKPEPK